MSREMIHTKEKRILLQACSGRKIDTLRRVRAIEIYDGVAFRIIKKFLRENPQAANDLTILILSAEYGLISSETEIANYDRRMDFERAESLKMQIGETWTKLIGEKIGRGIFVNVGRDYLPALENIRFPEKARYASGKIGYKNGQLKNWLNE